MKNGDPFIETQQYALFSEFCDNCIKYQYIGLCYGAPGLGKTRSARQYSNWDKFNTIKFSAGGGRHFEYFQADKSLDFNAVFYTPSVGMNSRTIYKDINSLRERIRLSSRTMAELGRKNEILLLRAKLKREKEMKAFVESIPENEWDKRQDPACYDFETSPTLYDVQKATVETRRKIKDPTQLIIIDEAERLSPAGLDQIRYMYDEGGVGLIFIGMPGIEKKFYRYPQLSSRVGFVHKFNPLTADQIRQFWVKILKTYPVQLEDNFIDNEALTLIIRSVHGNFRSLERLLAQIARILEINHLTKITEEVVEVACESLVFGAAA